MQHAKSRKILSFILSLALIVGLVPSIALPAAEAADGDTVITYDFKYYGEDKTENNRQESMIGQKYQDNAPETEGVTYGYWEHLSHCFVSAKTPTRYTLNGDWQVSFRGAVQAAGGYGDWIAFKVKGLTSGLYDVKMRSYYYSEARNHEIGLYLLPMSIFEDTTLTAQNAIHGIIKDGVISDTEEGKKIGNASKFLYTELKNTTNPGYINFGNVQVTDSTSADEWVLAVKLESLATTYTGTSDYVFFPEITFTRQPLGTLTAADTAVNVGDKIDLEVSLVDAENAAITDAEITVSSESESIVVTDQGELYAVRPGTAEVTVTAEKDGKLEETTATVTIAGGESVFASGDASYVFKQGIYEIDNTNGWVYNIDDNKANEIYSSYGTTGRNWKFVDTTCTTRDGTGNSINIGTASYMATGTKENEWSAWCVQVPKAGKYVVDLAGLCYTGGGMAEVYMTPYTEGMDVKSAITAENLVGKMDEYSTTSGVQEKTIGLFDAEAHGEYLMVIRGAKNDAGNTYLHISSVTLNGADYYIAPESADIFGNKAVYVEKADDGSYTAHFAAGINSLDYKEVGFKVSVAAGAEETLSTTAAYDTVVVAGGDVNGDVTAIALGLNSGYVFWKDKSGIAAGSEITFTPYAIELDGTEIIGKTYRVAVTAAAE